MKAQQMNGIAGGFLTDVLSLGVCETGKGIRNVDTADVGW